MKKMIRIILVVFFIIIFIGQLALFLYFSELNSSFNEGMSIKGCEVVIIVTEGYSENDLRGVKQYLDEWYGSISIVGINTNVTSSEGQNLKIEVILSEIENISIYDAIFIPGGELATNQLINNQEILSFLINANDKHLVIAGIGEGTLLQAASGIITGKRFATDEDIIVNLTSAGGIYEEGANVIVDGNIITACSSHYEELSYAIANTLGYSFTVEADISFEKTEAGWNYTIIVELSDKNIIKSMIINLSRQYEDDIKELVQSLLINKEQNGIFKGNLGILPNGYYRIDIKTESIYGKIETRYDVLDFSVGGN